MGTGTLDEALAWVEYCNGAGDAYWARRRRAGGRDEPYRVRYWGLGNEMYGSWQVGALSAAEYVRQAMAVTLGLVWWWRCRPAALIFRGRRGELT